MAGRQLNMYQYAFAASLDNTGSSVRKGIIKDLSRDNGWHLPNPTNAATCCGIVLSGYYTKPPQNFPDSKDLMSKRVTTSKLLEPPFKALNRSGVDSLTLMTLPYGRTSS